jgi:DNA-binding transcriptional ArsR family regulator
MPAVHQQQAKALGDPTRHRIFGYVAEAAHPVGVSELAAHLGLNQNAVRQHLAVLRDAELVIEQREDRKQLGRPRLLYRLRPEAASSWGSAGPYGYLASLLSTALGDGTDPRATGRVAGRSEADHLDTSLDPLDAIEKEMTRRGFRPTQAARDPSRT